MSGLQARIKRRSNEISYLELFSDKENIAELRFEQILDKRLMGQLVRLGRSRRALMRIVAGE